MLVIRLQRTGRKGHAQYRLVAQDSRFSVSSGRVVSYLGSYNPHTKEAKIDGEAVAKYLDNGAQVSDRVAGLLKANGIKLPDWVKASTPSKRAIRNPEKLRRNRPEEPKEEPAPVAEEAPAEETPVTEEAAPVAEVAEEVAETPAAEPTPEEPAAKTE